MATAANDVAGPQQPSQPTPTSGDGQQRGGVIGWVKGRMQKRSIAASMNNINLDAVEKNAVTAVGGEKGEPSDLDIAMGLANDNPADGENVVKDEDKIDMEAENDPVRADPPARGCRDVVGRARGEGWTQAEENAHAARAYWMSGRRASHGVR